MTKSWNPKRSRKHYDKTGAVVLNRVTLGHAPISLTRIRWKHRGLWVLLTLALVAAGLALWLTIDARFYIYDTQITGNRRLSHQEIFEASGLSGLHILWARSAAIESRILEAFPSLESVEANCQLPSECTIAVAERRPRVLWNDNGELWWIDENGAVFAAPDDAASETVGMGSGQAESLGDASGHWVVTGPLPREEGRVPGHLDDQVSVALAELWKSGRDLPGDFQYAPGQGLSFIDEHGWRIIVGRGCGMDRRLQVLDRVVAHLESDGVTPRFVDVRFPETPYYEPTADEGAGLREGGYAVVSSLLSRCRSDGGTAPS